MKNKKEVEQYFNFYNDKLYEKILNDYENFSRRLDLLAYNYNCSVNLKEEISWNDLTIDIIKLFYLDLKFLFINKKTNDRFYFHISFKSNKCINYKNNLKFNSIDLLFYNIEKKLKLENFNPKKQIILGKIQN
jgi:hypothetical protein